VGDEESWRIRDRALAARRCGEAEGQGKELGWNAIIEPERW